MRTSLGMTTVTCNATDFAGNQGAAPLNIVSVSGVNPARPFSRRSHCVPSIQRLSPGPLAAVTGGVAEINGPPVVGATVSVIRDI